VSLDLIERHKKDRAKILTVLESAPSFPTPQDIHSVSVPVPHVQWCGQQKGEYEGEALSEYGDRTPVKMPFEWLTKDIMVMRNTLDHYPGGPGEAIRVAESVNNWRRTDVMTADDKPRIIYDDESRNNDALSIWRGNDEALVLLERALMLVSSAAVFCYQTNNTFLDVRHDMGYLLNRYREGQYFRAHIDTVRNDAYLALRRLSLVIFLNSVEEGGELLFIRDNIKIKPEPGLAVAFPAGITHPHEACEVTKGVKYAIVTWYV